MNVYERIFGAGPRGLIVSCILLYLCFELEEKIGMPAILASTTAIYTIALLLAVLGASLAIWSIRSLPPSKRGAELCTTGAFSWFRHPLYASFLSFINFAIAIFLNNWIYVLWAVLQHPVWHVNISYEERLVRREFGEEYALYAKKTGRFLPRISCN